LMKRGNLDEGGITTSATRLPTTEMCHYVFSATYAAGFAIKCIELHISCTGKVRSEAEPCESLFWVKPMDIGKARSRRRQTVIF
jgi:hypothetical protein